MMRTLMAVLVGFLMVAGLARAAEVKLENKAWFNLWEGKAPGQMGEKPEDIPAMQVFLPEEGKGTGSSIVVCPGGGYGGLAAHEAGVVGEWLAKNGVVGFVLRYRLGSKGYHHPIEMGDGSRAIRFVRAHAAEWKLDPKRIGILGFSAGGHLASTIATHWDEGNAKSDDPIERVSSRPDAQVLIYPVVTMGPTGHSGSRVNLLGKEKAEDKELVELLSNEKQVNGRTPPAFLVHGIDDKAVPVSNSDNYAAALKKAGVEVEFVRLEHGAHGFGLRADWTGKCVEWLQKIKF